MYREGEVGGAAATLDRPRLIPVQIPSAEVAPFTLESTATLDLNELKSRLGLTDIISIEQSAEQKAADRKKVAAEYLADQEQFRKEHPDRRIDELNQYKKDAAEGWWEIQHRLTRKDRVDRIKVSFRLLRAGIKNPNQVLHFFEVYELGTRAHLIFTKLGQHPTKEEAWKEVRRRSYKDFYKNLSPETYSGKDNLEGLKILTKNGGDSLDRFLELQRNTYVPMTLHSLTRPELAASIAKLGAIPKDKFNQAVQAFERYPCLIQNRYYYGDDFEHLESLISTINQLDNSPEQLEVLDLTQRVLNLAERINRDGVYSRAELKKGFLGSGSITEYTEKKQRLTDSLVILEQAVLEIDALAKGNREQYKITAFYSGDYLKVLNRLDEQTLAQFARLVRGAFGIGENFIKYISFDRDQTDQITEEIRDCVRRSTNFQDRLNQDPKLKEFFGFFRQLHESEPKNEEFRALFNLSNIGTLENLYSPENLRVLNTLTDLATMVYGYPAPSEGSKNYYANALNHFLLLDPEKGLKPDYWLIRQALDHELTKSALTGKEKEFWALWRLDFIGGQISGNDDRIKYLMLTDKKRFVGEMIDGRIPDFFFRKYQKELIDKLATNPATQTHELKFFLDPKTAPLVLKGLAEEMDGAWRYILPIISYPQYLEELFVNGVPQPILFEINAVNGSTLLAERKWLTEEVLAQFSEPELQFYNYLKTLNYTNRKIREVLFLNRDQFSNFVVDDKPTPLFLRKIVEHDSKFFVENFGRDEMRIVLGDEILQNFLQALPKQTDEARNAFTKNKYDRTTEFVVDLLANSAEDFKVSGEDFEILTEYVKEFGLSKTPLLYHYFSNLTRFEAGQLTQLPEDIVATGVTSVEQLRQEVARIKALVYSEKPITEVPEFTPFEMQLLGFVTGKSTHSFSGGRPTLERMLQDFNEQVKNGEIAPLPEHYQTETIDLANTDTLFQKDAVLKEYEVLKDEILQSLQNSRSGESLKSLRHSVAILVEGKQAEIEKRIERVDPRQKEFLEREFNRLKEVRRSLEQSKTLDELMGLILDTRFDKSESKAVESITRMVIFSKIFDRGYSPAMIENLETLLSRDISASSIISIINLVDEHAKTHVLNLTQNNKEGYWAKEVFERIRDSKRGRTLHELFIPLIKPLKDEVTRFEQIQTGEASQVLAIPDRGLIGEMAGYLGNICYTAEYPLLKRWTNVVPYKFVAQNPGESSPVFIGSVLVFEVDTASDEPALLVRAFDIPNEAHFDIKRFFEEFVDKVDRVGKLRGKKVILVPGDSSAISNYQMTINYIRESYVKGKEPVSLKEPFNFNNYDLTNNCFAVRTIA